MDGLENLCSSVQDGVGFPSLEINEWLIPAHLTMLDEKECFSSHLSSGWNGFSSGFPSDFALGKSLGKPMPSLAQMRRVLHSLHLSRSINFYRFSQFVQLSRELSWYFYLNPFCKSSLSAWETDHKHNVFVLVHNLCEYDNMFF